MDISGKVTIITGASAGIGLATVKRFAAEGAKVVLAARSTDKLTALADELRIQGQEALSVPTDMRNPAAVNHLIEQAFEHYGRIDILINNAGQAAAGTVAGGERRYTLYRRPMLQNGRSRLRYPPKKPFARCIQFMHIIIHDPFISWCRGIHHENNPEH